MPHFLRLYLGTMSQVDKDIRKVLGVSRDMDAKGYVAYYPSLIWACQWTVSPDSRGWLFNGVGTEHGRTGGQVQKRDQGY